MRILITGCQGFVGRHLVAELLSARHEVFGFDSAAADPAQPFPVETGDLGDPAALRSAVRRFRPDGCVHLAGMASVPQCASQPELAFRVNVLGTLNLLAAFAASAAGGRILVISTAHVYGEGTGEWLDETAATRPDSVYALSKLYAEQASLLQGCQAGLSVLSARPVNHVGPGQSPHFVLSAFASQLATLARGHAEPRLRVGNLDSERDFLDVRDVVRGYRLLVEQGVAGETYHLAGGHSIPIRVALERLCALSGLTPERVPDPALFRPTDRSPWLKCDKIRLATGWAPERSLDETLRDLYADALKQSGPGRT